MTSENSGHTHMRDNAAGNIRDGRFTDTRERIVETARSLFATNGYTNTSIKDIADELGFTKAAVYYHFPAKADLAHAVFTPFVSDVEAVFTELEKGNPTPREVLEAFFDTLLPHQIAFAAMARDPGAVGGMELGEVGFQWIDRVSTLLVGEHVTAADRVRVTVAFGGLVRVLLVPNVTADVMRSAGIDAALAAIGKPD